MNVKLATLLIILNGQDIKTDFPGIPNNISKYMKQDINYSNRINKVEQKVNNMFAYPIGLSYDDYLRDLIAKMREGQRIMNFYGDYGSKDGIDVRRDKIHKYVKPGYNITSCEEFGRKGKFHPRYLFYTTWVSFYMWPDPDNFPSSETFLFEVPSTKLIKRYKELYDPHLETKINWNKPMLLMKMSGQNNLLVAKDLRGTFINIPEHAIPKIPETPYFKLHTYTIKIKIIDSYLGIMFCIPNETFAYACAPSDIVPDDPESRTNAAKTMGINTF